MIFALVLHQVISLSLTTLYQLENGAMEAIEKFVLVGV